MSWGNCHGGFPEYVPVGKRRARAKKEMDKLVRTGVNVAPVAIAGRTIARSFWGRAWCAHMESFHDYESRLPRGRSYVLNGEVIHLEIARGRIRARVVGQELYTVTLEVDALPAERWAELRRVCAGRVGSLVDLLSGRLSEGVMAEVVNPETGLFPRPKEFRMRCSCPDWADMCKHVAAACYGVGARLDEAPELLFRLRGVDHGELVAESAVTAAVDRGETAAREKQLEGDLAELFGIDLDPLDAPPAPTEPTAPTDTAPGHADDAPEDRGPPHPRQPPPTSARAKTMKPDRAQAIAGHAPENGAKTVSPRTAGRRQDESRAVAPPPATPKKKTAATVVGKIPKGGKKATKAASHPASPEAAPLPRTRGTRKAAATVGDRVRSVREKPASVLKPLQRKEGRGARGE